VGRAHRNSTSRSRLSYVPTYDPTIFGALRTGDSIRRSCIRLWILVRTRHRHGTVLRRLGRLGFWRLGLGLGSELVWPQRIRQQLLLQIVMDTPRFRRWRTSGRTPWTHDPGHRLGVAYPNRQLSGRFGTASQASRMPPGSRELAQVWRGISWNSFREGRPRQARELPGSGGHVGLQRSKGRQGSPAARSVTRPRRSGTGIGTALPSPGNNGTRHRQALPSPAQRYRPGAALPGSGTALQSAPRISTPTSGGEGAVASSGGGGSRSFGGGGAPTAAWR